MWKGASSLTVPVTLPQAREAGRGLGRFHRLTADLDPTLLADTLPGFHVTPGYLAAYDRLAERKAAGRAGKRSPAGR